MFGTIGAEKRQLVGLAVTPNLGLEACVYDKNSKEVVKYAQKFIEYNIASREIQDINAFRSAVFDIFSEIDIARENANVYLVLPNVHFGFRSFDDPSMDSDAIESMILSEASESYIFKQQEPISAWANVNAKTSGQAKYIAHSSFQRNVVEEIEDICTDIGVNLVGIETSASAIPRGIAISGICDDVISADSEWDILLINTNGYAIFQMSGKRLIDYVEVPFAIMSFDGDEVYSALSSAVGQYLPNYPAKKLVIVSLTDNVSAVVLKDEITFDEEIVSIDSNAFANEPCINVAGEYAAVASSISPSAIGASSPKSEFVALNVLKNASYDASTQYGSIGFGGKEILITSDSVSKFSIILSSILGVIAVIVALSLFGIKTVYGEKYSTTSNKVTIMEREVNELQSKVRTSISSLVKQISENNKLAINYYDSLASDIPQNLWLSYYVNKNGTEVGIEGYSLEINDIYEYFNSLKILAPKSEIKLNKLEVFKDNDKMDSSDIDSIVLDARNEKQQVFSFQIANTSYEKTFDDKGNASGSNDGKQQKSPAARIPNVPDVEINLKEIE